MRTIPTILTLFVFAASCASQSPATTPDAPRTSDGALMTMEGEGAGPVWAEWEPVESGQQGGGVPRGLAGRFRAFDYWEVEEAGQVDAVWDGVFPVLDSVRAGMQSERHRRTARVLLEALERAGEAEPVRMDVTFVVSNRKERRVEGVACRLWRRLENGATPVVTVLLLREPAGRSGPGRIVVWATPGFREAGRWTAVFDLGSDGWRRSILDGLVLEGASGRSAEESVGVAARVLTETIWKPYSGTAYTASAGDGGERAGEEAPDAALGLEVGERGIEQVYSGTEFPPRVDADTL